MTEAELAEIEARAAKATEPPWSTGPVDDDPTLCRGIWRGEYEHDTIVRTDAGIYPPTMPDAEFIAHARSDVPRMVGEIRRLRAMLSLTERREAAEHASGARYSVALDKVAEIVSGVLTRLADAPERDSQTLSELHPVLEERDRAYSAS